MTPSISSSLVHILSEFLLKRFHIFKIFLKKGSILYITDLTFTETSLLDKAFHVRCNLCDYLLLECANESNWYKKISECSGY